MDESRDRFLNENKLNNEDRFFFALLMTQVDDDDVVVFVPAKEEISFTDDFCAALLL